MVILMMSMMLGTGFVREVPSFLDWARDISVMGVVADMAMYLGCIYSVLLRCYLYQALVPSINDPDSVPRLTLRAPAAPARGFIGPPRV